MTFVANTLKASVGKDGGGYGHEMSFVAETVRSHPRPGSNSNGGMGLLELATSVARLNKDASVRRLTPTECERLQGLPDGWTHLGGTPDSKRYAALGDAVTANVSEWIGGRLMAAEEGR